MKGMGKSAKIRESLGHFTSLFLTTVYLDSLILVKILYLEV